MHCKRLASVLVTLLTSLALAVAANACTTETVIRQAPTEEDGGSPTEPNDEDLPSSTKDGGAATKDAGRKPAACSAFGGTCEDNASCCTAAPYCAANGACCVGEGAKKNGGSCFNGDDCCSGACATSQGACCAYDKQACTTSSECCPGFECGSDGKCGQTVGASCGGELGCAKGLLCADKVKSLGGGSSTTEPDKCCVPGGESCGTSEDCCIESSSITGVQCYKGLCKRSYGSSCTIDAQCTYKCVSGTCG